MNSKLKKIVAQNFPDSFLTDRILNYFKFVVDHKRAPSSKMLFNDYLYRLKQSGELDKPLRSFISDKEYVKLYIKAVVGDQYNVPTICVVKSYEEFLGLSLPHQCCIKPTHASGEVIIKTESAQAIPFSKVESWFSLNYYRVTRERNYRNLTPKVIVEPVIFGEGDLTDYRFFCYKGRVRLISLDIGKYTSYRRAVYDRNWVKQDFSIHHPIAEDVMQKPHNLEEMIEVAESLSSGFEFIRVDIYSDGSSCMVGELTNCHAGASQSFIPLSAEKQASDIIFDVN